MPIHNWKKTDARLFHHFHQSWSVNLAEGLNAGVLPDGLYALVEQKALGVEPDVLTLSSRPRHERTIMPSGGIAVATSPPKTRYVNQLTEEEVYAARANRVSVRTKHGGRWVNEFIVRLALLMQAHHRRRVPT